MKNVLEKNIEGAFKLQPQSYLAKPAPLVAEFDEKLTKIEETFNQIQEGKDDNLVLKYLELNSVDNHWQSDGRTPFTLTKTISKSNGDAFGFEISWTNPPRINSVRNPSQNFDLRKGDYIIFVGDVNIVTMPKEEVIELIRKQENQLTLEIFRPVGKISGRDIIEALASQDTPVLNSGCAEKGELKSVDLPETPKSHKTCHFKQPKICFQPTVGSGVIV